MSTRETILSELKRRGAAKADDLAETLSLTAMAVRQHLYQLREEGAVVSVSKSSGRGRPSKYWQLTPKADVYFPDTHRDLSLDLIESIKATMGEDALDKLIDHRSQKQLAAYLSSEQKSASLQDKLSSLADARIKEGYMAEVVDNKDGTYLLIENHCPICEAAKVCSGLCAKELSIFQEYLKEDADVNRSEHILKGARRCAYKIVPKDNT